jgi:hypothetical protein
VQITNPETEETRTFTFDYSYWSHDDFEEQDDGLLLPVRAACRQKISRWLAICAVQSCVGVTRSVRAADKRAVR